MNNIAPDIQMPTDQYGRVAALRDAVNVDVHNQGAVRRRPGIQQLVADQGAHSIFSTDAMVIWATTTTLKVSKANLEAQAVLTTPKLSKPISYVMVNGDVYFSNELVNGIIRADGSYEPWGIVPPVTAPTLSGRPGSNKYQVTCTFIANTGEESGAPVGATISTGDTPSIQLSEIPQSSDTRVVATRIYITNIDGVEFQSVIDIPKGITSWVLAGFFARGETLKTQFMEPPPPGQLLELHNGVIYIASGINVVHTEPLNFGVYDPANSFFMNSSRVTLLKAVLDGLYVGTDQIRFLPSIGTDAVEEQKAKPYRAVEGAVCELPDTEDFMFMSDRGFVRAGVGGQLTDLTDRNIAVDYYDRGAMGYVITNGHKAVIAVFKNGQPNSAVAKDFLDGKIVWGEEKRWY